MGGKLVQKYGFPEKRLSVEDFHKLVVRVEDEFSKVGYKFRHEVVPYYRSKQSFGDLDYLVELDDNFNYRDFIQNNFSSSFVHNNGGVYSFEVSGFQVDFILVPTLEYEFTKAYFSYNDSVGNLCGRLFNKMGLSLGHQGLFYKLTEDKFTGDEKHKANSLGYVLLTLDPRKAWEFLGYDYDKVVRGFDTLEESFEFVLDCDYFDPDVYDYDNLNHINRVRNRKRENYQKFLDLVTADKEKYRRHSFQDENFYFDKVLNGFKHLSSELEVEKSKYLFKKELWSKFNGDLVMEWTGLSSGDQLGKAIVSFKRNYQNFDEYLASKTHLEVKQDFLETWKP